MRPEWLVCAATQMELETFWSEGKTYKLESPAFPNPPDGEAHLVSGVGREPEYTTAGEFADDNDRYALTGVGIPFTIARLLPIVQRLRPKHILNIGIAGAYPNSRLKIGDIVMGATEVYGDLGFELPVEPGFQSLLDSPMASQMDAVRFDLGELDWALEGTSALGAGCTVNCCTGTEQTGLLREQRYGAHFETMEGAAVAHVGFITQTPVYEIRAISNIAAQRDMRPQNIFFALTNLRFYLHTRIV
jgi:nucleoside phosphorylase